MPKHNTQPDSSAYCGLIPAAYQPTAVAVQGTKINAAIAAAKTHEQIAANSDRFARKQRDLTEIIVGLLTAGGADPSETGMAQALMLTALADSAQHRRRYQQDPTVLGMKMATVFLGMEYFIEDPDALLRPIQYLNPSHRRPLPPAMESRPSRFEQEIIKKRLTPLPQGQNFRNLFRELPAPLLLAGFGWYNCRHLADQVPPTDPISGPTCQLAARVWKQIGAGLMLVP